MRNESERRALAAKYDSWPKKRKTGRRKQPQMQPRTNISASQSDGFSSRIASTIRSETRRKKEAR
jgi:hypothetical protein